MKCEECRELLWAYMEQELQSEKLMELEAHLAECADCRRELEMQQEVMEVLQSLPDEELPEGYHQELMQKLRAEAAPNVVPFPVKQKQPKWRQPKWRQLSMIAAAALVVVAAGGINGIMEMRRSQNEAVYKIEATADTAAPFEMEEAVEESGMDEAEKQPMEMAQKTDTGTGTSPIAEQKSTSVVPSQPNAVKEEKKSDFSAESSVAEGAMPQVASIVEDEAAVPYSMVRTAAPEEATDTAILQVADLQTAMMAIRESIVAADGYEGAASAENSILAVIPIENYESFGKALEGLGALQWTQKGKLAEGEAFRSVEIQLNEQ